MASSNSSRSAAAAALLPPLLLLLPAGGPSRGTTCVRPYSIASASRPALICPLENAARHRQGYQHMGCYYSSSAPAAAPPVQGRTGRIPAAARPPNKQPPASPQNPTRSTLRPPPECNPNEAPHCPCQTAPITHHLSELLALQPEVDMPVALQQPRRQLPRQLQRRIDVPRLHALTDALPNLRAAGPGGGGAGGQVGLQRPQPLQGGACCGAPPTVALPSHRRPGFVGATAARPAQQAW